MHFPRRCAAWRVGRRRQNGSDPSPMADSVAGCENGERLAQQPFVSPGPVEQHAGKLVVSEQNRQAGIDARARNGLPYFRRFKHWSGSFLRDANLKPPTPISPTLPGSRPAGPQSAARQSPTESGRASWNSSTLFGRNCGDEASECEARMRGQPEVSSVITQLRPESAGRWRAVGAVFRPIRNAGFAASN